MATPIKRRQSIRARNSEVNYKESPKYGSKFHNKDDNSEILTGPKTPKTKEKSTRKPQDDSPVFSPMKLRTNRTPSLQALTALGISPPSEEIKKSRTRKSRISTDTPKRPKSDRKQNKTPLTKVSPIVIDLKKKTLMKTKKAKTLSFSPEEAESSDEEESFEVNTENIAKPTTLFDDDEDVDGKKLFSFRTPRKDSMALLAQQTPKTPRHNDPNRITPRTPKTSRLSEIQNTPTSRPSASKSVKTPRHIREETKKKLKKKQFQHESDDGFSTSESESEGSSSSEDSLDEESETEASPPKKSKSVSVIKTPSVALAMASTPSTRRSSRNNPDFILQSDDYFSAATAKSKTSDHTLDRLKNSRVPQDELRKLMANMQLSKEHEEAIKHLNEEHKSCFDKWLTLFDEGYTVLLHGFGSKRNLLQSFHKEKLSNEHVLVTNGFFPSLTIKEILDIISVDLLEQTSSGGNPQEMVNMIEKEMQDIPALHLFLIIHNIDGVMLRNDRAQGVLSRLASIKNIHMIATIDHINTPLLWNNMKLSNFNFVWFDVTSFLPYDDETTFENSLLVQNSGALELSSMKSVFQSLTTNARGIYILLIKFQLENNRNPNYQGISIKDLYTACREAFLVSSVVALRAQLTEFLDHKLARLKRTIDGAENVMIPIKNVWLQEFLNDQ